MSLPDRRQFLTLLAALPLAGCGFTPVYGPNGAGTRLQGRVAFATPVSRADFQLVTALQNRLGATGTAAYDLGYSVTTSVEKGGFVNGNEITRYTLRGNAAYTLTDHATRAVLAKGTVLNFTSWSATGSTVAGIAAEEAASERLMQLLADDIVTALLARLT